MALFERLSGLDLSRRKVMLGAAAAGGLLVAWSFWPRNYRSPLIAADKEAQFGGWLKIARDGVVSVAVPQLEMGQGVGTLLAQVAAVELGADWRQVGLEPVPPSGFFANLPLAAEWAPLWSNVPALAGDADDWLVERFARSSDFDATAGGTSLAAFELPLRMAAASARDMLVRTAAARWDVAPEECDADAGFVVQGSKRFPFGALVDDAAALEPPDPAPLRPAPASEQPLPGEADASTAFPRIDLPSKVDGSHVFAADVRLPGMLYASIRRGPIGLPELFRFDEKATAGMDGLVGVVKSQRWLAAVATSWWIADRALARMRPHFNGPGGLEQSALERALGSAVELSAETAERLMTVGEPDSMLAQPAISRSYSVAPALHASLETASATAWLRDGRLELWIASQAPGMVRKAVAKTLGLALADVVLYPVSAGGSFDARLERDHAIQVALIAQQIGRPVQLTWSRTQEMQSVPPRAPVAARIDASLGAQGQPTALRTRIIAPAAMLQVGGRLFDDLLPDAACRANAERSDAAMVDGAATPYGIAHVAVEHAPADIPLPVGWMRGGAHAWSAFFTESFIDELAVQAARDPFLYRMAMLGKAPRMAECLRRATRLASWDGGRRGSGQGLAMVRMGHDARGGGRIACVAQAGLAEGGVRVERLSAAVDIGRIVNLDLARQQIEGGLIFGLSLALGSSLRFASGHPSPRRLAGLDLPTLADCPDIVVDFIASDAEPFDPGELGVAVAAPAIANALHAATGLRMRHLPLMSEGI